jgi:hypothetical protein
MSCLLGLTGLSGGCKASNSKSDLQSLNNFARSDATAFVPNDCTGGPGAENNVVLGINQEWDHVDFSEVPVAERDARKSDLKRALSAVPANLQELYFGLGGTIKFSNNPAAACGLTDAKAQFAQEGQSQMHACWDVDKTTKDFVIHMQPKQEAIRHATVRMFGYILSQVLTSVTMNDQNKIVYERDESFDDAVALISNAFMDDVRANISAAKAAGRTPKYDMATNKDLVKDKDFRFYVFAEAFDSYYCTAALRQEMAKKGEFPKTHEQFAKLDAALNAVKVANQTAAASLTDAPIGIDPEYAAAAGAQLWGGRLLGGVARVGAGIGRGIFRGGAAVIGGGARLLGGAVRGTGALFRGAGRMVGRGAVGIGRFLFGGG